jgi:hypothetical protein
MAAVPSEHLLIEVSWHDGRKALIDVLVIEDLGDEIKPASVGETVHSIDPDVLENDDVFRAFVQEIAGHASDGDVVRAATLDLWRGALLDRLGVKGGDPPTPIPYDAEGD